MQIQLKQLEIEAALKVYIAQQGINLAGKTVEIAFTSGRKDNGLSAEIVIEDLANNAPVIPVGLINRNADFPVTSEIETVEVSKEPEVIAVKPVSLFNP